MQPRKSIKLLLTDGSDELIEIGEIENIEKLKKIYLDFSNKRKYDSDTFKVIEQSFENFKKSSNYQKLSNVQKSKLEKSPPTKVIIFKFNCLEDAKDFIYEMGKRGILKPEIVDELVNKLKQYEEEHNHARPRR